MDQKGQIRIRNELKSWLKGQNLFSRGSFATPPSPSIWIRSWLDPEPYESNPVFISLRIRIQLFTLLRILLLMKVSTIFSLQSSWILTSLRIRILFFAVTRIRIQLSKIMRIRIRNPAFCNLFQILILILVRNRIRIGSESGSETFISYLDRYGSRSAKLYFFLG